MNHLFICCSQARAERTMRFTDQAVSVERESERVSERFKNYFWLWHHLTLVFKTYSLWLIIYCSHRQLLSITLEYFVGINCFSKWQKWFNLCLRMVWRFFFLSEKGNQEKAEVQRHRFDGRGLRESSVDPTDHIWSHRWFRGKEGCLVFPWWAKGNCWR